MPASSRRDGSRSSSSPAHFDSRLGTFDAWGILFFVTSAMLFINIHHYFIDNVIWRFKDPEVRAYLLG